MKSQALALTLLTASTLLSGCGAALSTITPVTPAAPASLAGNWQMQIQSTTTGTTLPTISILMPGALSVQGPTVSGILRVVEFLPGGFPSPCLSSTQGIAFTGTVDASSLLTLTSTPFSGSIATLKLQLPLVNSNARGTAQIVGGTCATPSTPLIAIYVPSVTGTFAGTLSPLLLQGLPANNNTAGPASITLTQGPANPDGQFPVTGALTVNSTSCALTATPFTGTISGISLSLKGPAPGVTFNNGPLTFPSATLNAGALLAFNPELFAVTLDAFGNPATCSAGLYRGDFPRQ